MGKVTKTVQTPEEYKEITEAANTLDLEISRAFLNGDWRTSEGHPVGNLGAKEIEKVGRKYFYVRLSDDSESGSSVYKLEARTNSTVRGPGKIRIELS